MQCTYGLRAVQWSCGRACTVVEQMFSSESVDRDQTKPPRRNPKIDLSEIDDINHEVNQYYHDQKATSGGSSENLIQEPTGMGYEDEKRWKENQEKLKKKQEILRNGGKIELPKQSTREHQDKKVIVHLVPHSHPHPQTHFVAPHCRHARRSSP